MVVSGKHRILSLSVLSIALITYLRVRLNRTLKKREEPAKGTDSQASVGQSYEVFLSFHGDDTRHKFTDFLYDGMVKVGIYVFRDNESLHVGQRIGDELLQAIQNSKIYVPIFSKNYASSHWCLRELAYMVKCASKSNGDKEILPIFLDVEPRDVKLNTDLYRKALSKHLKKFRTEVESWRKALMEVDEIKGWNWGEREGQAKLTKSVIETVSQKLNVGYKRTVPEYLVGVDDHVEAIIKMLDLGADNVQFLGIHGMGGIGKTTLAKVIFNKLSSSFRGYKFLSDVGESSRRPEGLVSLQKELLSMFPDPCPNLDKIHDTDDGINEIKRFIGNRKVLIVLDDVDETVQLESLVAKGDHFGPGSIIIITTRDQNVLRIMGEATGNDIAQKSSKVLTYEVPEMKFDDALTLLSRRAFGSDSLPNQYLLLAKEIVSILGNLPLAIEVIGSSLQNEPKEDWEDTLKKLKDAPPFDVQRKLKTSYDKLEIEQQKVFLDIACFFVNEDKTYPSYMWDACKYHPRLAIKVLFRKSLIKINDDDTFWMHDQLRDLGRNIVCQENHEDLRKRSRVWKHEDALNILKQGKGSKKIEALSFGGPFHEDIIIKHDAYADLQNLRFFRGREVSFVGDFNNLLSNLKWLSCRFASKFEAKNFHPTNLVVLDLSWSKISEESFGWIKEARKLKVLDLSCCDELRRTPDLSTLVSLEILNLQYCSMLDNIDCIKEATKLKILDLSQCTNLRRTPDLSTLESLEIFRLCQCENIRELPYSIGKLQSLIELDLIRTGIDHLPNSFGNLKQLKTLRMFDIEEGLTKLPNAVWLVQTVVDPDWFPKDALWLSCMKMPDLPWTQISGLPTVASLVSNIGKLEEERQESGRILDHEEGSLDPLRELKNVFFFPDDPDLTDSQVEKEILASPNMRFLVQLPSSSREEVFRELTDAHLKELIRWPEECCWMPIFLGVGDSESEKLLMQECTISRRLARLMPEMEGSTPPGSPQP